MSVKEDLQKLKEYCYNYIEREYGKKQNYIRKSRITKNGLFLYGHKCYAPAYNMFYDVYTYISWIDCDNYNHIINLLENFVNDCKRLKEV